MMHELHTNIISNKKKFKKTTMHKEVQTCGKLDGKNSDSKGISRKSRVVFKDNYKTLSKTYKNQWIIIQNKSVIAKGNTFEQIRQHLPKNDVKSALVEFIGSNNTAMFF